MARSFCCSLMTVMVFLGCSSESAVDQDTDSPTQADPEPPPVTVECTSDSDCDDGNLCTVNECSLGSCLTEPIVCSGGETCVEGFCGECVGSFDCDDGNPCTEDSCINRNCQSTSIACSDGVFCNGLESCSGGECQSGPPPCSINEVCDEDSNLCITPAPEPAISEGIWVLVTDIPGTGGLDGACLVIENGLVTSWFDGCGPYDNLLAPATILYDDTGPWFSIYLIDVGDIVVFLTRSTDDLYSVEIDTPFGDFFGFMERAALDYPAIILEPNPPFCDFICIQFLPFGTVYCDSDCDGWFDGVELEFGDDPCNPFSPPFSPPPEVAAQICPLIFGRSQQLTHEEAVLRTELQREALAGSE